ncbi:MAG: hypothetical protein HY530_07505 [Chloroflexi bacterium]|nr:hypothetical protein [Chloroflexota bacterium]
MSNRSLTPEEQFIIYHDRLRYELNTAYTYYEIAKYLGKFSHTRRSEFIEAQTFFQVTIDANLFAAVMTINRGFVDNRGDCLQLDGFFDVVRVNLNLFSTEAFKKRQAGKGMSPEDIEHWAKLHIEITPEMVREDEERVKNVPIDNLKSWRNKKLAHIDKQQAVKNISVMKAKPVTVGEIDGILMTLDGILNRYLVAYNGTSWAIGLPPVKPEIEYVMDAIKSFRQSRKERK